MVVEGPGVLPSGSARTFYVVPTTFASPDRRRLEES